MTDTSDLMLILLESSEDEEEENFLATEASGLRAIADERLASKEYAKAEAFYLKFFAKTDAIPSWSTSDLLEVKMCLAAAYSAQAKYSQARDILQAYVDKEDLNIAPAQQFQMTHRLAEACFSCSDYKPAAAYGKTAFWGRRKVFGKKNPAVHESAFLLVKVLSTQGEEEEAELYRRFMPNQYALITAARENRHDTVQILLKGGAPVNGKLEDGETALLAAAHKGHAAIVTTLLDGGADTEASRRDGETALYLAVTERHDAVVKILLDRGANTEAKKEGITSLYISSEKGYDTSIKELLKHGADVEVRYKTSYTPLYVAAFNGRDSTVQILLNHGVNIEAKDNDGITSLYMAAQKGHDGVVKILIKHGANIEATYKESFSPLYVAAYNGREAVIETLIAHGARIEARAQDGATSLYTASHMGHEGVVNILLKHGAAIDAAKWDGATALFLTAQDGLLPMLQLLISHGANVEAALKDGARPLFIAAQNGHEPAVRALLDAKAEIDSKYSDGSTPLHIATLRGHEAVVQTLVNRGASLEMKPPQGQTPLECAAEAGNEAIARILLRNGAKVTDKSISLATTKEHLDLATILEESRKASNQAAAEELARYRAYNPHRQKETVPDLTTAAAGELPRSLTSHSRGAHGADPANWKLFAPAHEMQRNGLQRPKPITWRDSESSTVSLRFQSDTWLLTGLHTALERTKNFSGSVRTGGFELYLPPTAFNDGLVILDESTQTFYEVNYQNPILHNRTSWWSLMETVTDPAMVILPDQMVSLRERTVGGAVGNLVSITARGDTIKARKVGVVFIQPSRNINWNVLKEMKGPMLPNEMRAGLMGWLWNRRPSRRSNSHDYVTSRNILDKMPCKWHLDGAVLNQKLDNQFAAASTFPDSQKWDIS